MTRNKSETFMNDISARPGLDSDPSSRRISACKVIIPALNKKEFETLVCPESLRNDPIIDTILNGFALPWYVHNLGPSAQSHIALSIKRFFSFVDENLESVTQHDTANTSQLKLRPDCFKIWFDYLKENQTHYNVWKFTADVLKVFTKSLDAKFGKATHWPKILKQTWKILKSHVSSKPQHAKLPPLGPYLGIHEEYTNRELLLGLRYGSMWLLKKLAEFRRLFNTHETIAGTLEHLKGQEIGVYQSLFAHLSRTQRNKSSSDQRFKLNAIASESWNIIKSDELLSEWQFYCFSRYGLLAKQLDKDILCKAADRNLLLERCQDLDGRLRKRPIGLGHSDKRWAPLRKYFGCSAAHLRIPSPCFWGPDWIVHSSLEKLLMVWILASERAQKSGVEKLTFNGLIYSNDDKSLQISTQKMRRLKGAGTNFKAADVETMIYNKREPAYSTYDNWLYQEKVACQNIANYNLEQFFIPNSTGATVGNITSTGVLTVPMLPLLLLTINGSSWQQAFLDDTSQLGQREANAFIKILSNRTELASIKKEIRLPMSPIAQSLIVEQQRGTNIPNQIAKVESEALGHTFTTGRNIYKDGFRRIGIKEILDPVKAFSRKVGDKKFQLAIRMAERLSAASRKVSLAEVQEMSGIESSTLSQEKLLNILDEKDILTISGELRLSGETLIVQTDMTAGLMAGYMDHLEGEIAKLETTNREDAFIRHAAKLIYLHQIFQSFPMRLQVLGKKLAAEMDFRFPPLS